MRKPLFFIFLGVGATVGGIVWYAVGGGERRLARDVLAAYDEAPPANALTILYPFDGAVFPPEIVPPRFRWTDESAADMWVVRLSFGDDRRPLAFICDRPEWTPDAFQWERIKRRSVEDAAQATVVGVARENPSEPLTCAAVTFQTSADPVGAPIFYREVNLPFIDAVKDPSRIRWRFGTVDTPEPPPVVLTGLPVCGNCHSFSADGATLGMDVDYANDKGSYAIAAVERETTLANDDIITWSDFRRDDGELTFGLLSQVSPEGRYVVSTVKDRSIFVPRDELAYSQLFFPIKGILVVHDTQTGEYHALPGADDPAYVQSNPTWSPDGQTIVFARAPAHDLKDDRGNVLITKAQAREFLEDGKPFKFDLYRVPFNDGAGGVAEPIEGASHNGVSNYFAKYSPDGRWIVFCRAENYMLLQPDSQLYVIPAGGGAARRLACNLPQMNSWHSFAPNGRWLVFSSKAFTPYTQLFLTHFDEQGRTTPPLLLEQFTEADRAANIPEFVNAEAGAIRRIRESFIDDAHYVRAGDAHMAAGDDIPGAIAQYRQAITLNPQNAVAHSNLGGLLVTQGQLDAGVAHLQEAIRLDPQNASPHYNLGMLRFRQGREAEARQHLERTVGLDPEIAGAQRALGALLCNAGRPAEGLSHLNRAVELSPNDPAAHFLLGKGLMGQGMVESAAVHFERVIGLDPDHAAAHHQLALALFRMGRVADAIEHGEQAVRQHPDNSQLLTDLAWLLLATDDDSRRDPVRAAELARRACTLTGHEAVQPLDTLGIAAALSGDFATATWAARQALALAEQAGQASLAEKIRARLAGYERNEAYRPWQTP